MGKCKEWRDQFRKNLDNFKKRRTTISRILAAAMKMGVPMFVSACGMYAQLVLEHYATYLYVQRYFLTDEDGYKKQFKMYDPVSDALPDYIPKAMEANITKAMDTLAFFPAGIFFLITVICLTWSYRTSTGEKKGAQLTQKLFRQTVFGVWAKVCFMWAMLASLKGVFDAVTLQPDSIGWEKCKERLTPDFVRYFRQPDLTFFPDMFLLDFETLAGYYPGHKPPVRLCSDMMYSGHTFTVVVFCLGINELAYMALDEREAALASKTRTQSQSKCNTKCKISALIWLYVLCHQGLEIYVVLKTHFHYTSDVVAAIVFSFLMWTNAIIPYGAKLWATRRFRGFVPMLFTFNDPADPKKEPLLSSRVVDEDASHSFSQEDRIFIPAGEILVPGGQQHVYTDRQFKTLLRNQKHLIAKNVSGGVYYDVPSEEQSKKLELTQQHVVRYCQQNMSMNDGVFIRDYCLEKTKEEEADDLIDYFHENDTVFIDWLRATKDDIVQDTTGRVKKMWLVQLVIPILIGAIVFMFTRFSWTWATYTYVHHYMLEGNQTDPRLFDPVRHWLHKNDSGLKIDRHVDNTNQYVFYILIFLTMLFMLSLVSKKSTRPCALQVFHKASISVNMSAIITSILVLVTAVPDSVGPERCEYVLSHATQRGHHNTAWEFMQQNHSLSEIFTQAFRSNVHCGISYGGWFQFLIILFLTYFEFVLLFLRKGFWKEWEKKEWNGRRWLKYVKFFAIALVGSVFMFLLYMENTRFQKNQLHYTMDLVMHLSLAFLLYTNSLVTIAAKSWSQCFLQDGNAEEIRFQKSVNSDGDVLIPPCCVPFCCLWGRYHLYSDQKVKELRSLLFNDKEGKMPEGMNAALANFKPQNS